mmetsp:Transcript_32261/g.102869  ORF Transcript_32261/g.102869 Transcript_32261/m.102869 type:complete len:324 (-) Transcript_32261:117-1088(-)|eukprot:CAMPEP_0118911188 /NCGR_PEP_ID=MMETSP1166-20130328/12992_1 /TAXON_ID=1104430 /ORGANISM="Chrysoreinhardia sp, Strain CCMP3193" /LENGTH=323 /DNA_ID=CAMNT_0006850665 /DNA_START=43 /DNA_END=1014 /DNA_ORIENTATION=+
MALLRSPSVVVLRFGGLPPDPRALRELETFDLEAELLPAVKASAVEFSSLRPALERSATLLEKRKRWDDEDDERARKTKKKRFVFERILVAPEVSERPRLETDFAVSVMRAATPSDATKAEAVKARIGELREQEWPRYARAVGVTHAAPKKGDWRDAAFFDFMSWLQHVALSELHLFSSAASESRDDDGGHVEVVAHDRALGEAIWGKVRGGRASADRRQVIEDMKAGLERLCSDCGFAAKARLVDNYRNDPDTLRCDLALPANLWSAASLDRANAPFRNDLHLFAFNAALRPCHLALADVQRKASSDGRIAHMFTLVKTTTT